MLSEITQTRLLNQYKQIVEALKEDDDEIIDRSVRAACIKAHNSIEDLSEWYFIFTGKPNSPIEAGNYKIKVKIGQDYPFSPPEVYIEDGFEHYHVFIGGKICYRLLSKENWKMTFTIATLMNGIIKMLHSDPEINDPASTNFTQLIQRGSTQYHQPNLNRYNQFLANQAKRFKNRYQGEIAYFNDKIKNN